MIEANEFFEKLEEQVAKNFPFVAYRSPSNKNGETRALLQSYLDIYKTKNFTESGFVFAPFDDNEEAILISEEKSQLLETVYNEREEITLAPVIDYTNSQAIAEKERHLHLVQQGIDAINEGSFRKVVLSRKEVLQTGPQDALELFQRLLRKYPDAYVYLFHHPMVGTWLGATPEILLEVERNRFKTMALAGTQKYNNSLDITWGEKEQEEQQMVTDTIMENLKAIVPSGIWRSNPYTARAGNLVHIRTDITGEIPSELGQEDKTSNESSLLQPMNEQEIYEDVNNSKTQGTSGEKNEAQGALEKLLAALHPTPAVCGLPKEAAKKFILNKENYNREFYTGFLGEINMPYEVKRSSNRNNQENQAYASRVSRTSLYVNLRCMKLNEDKTELFVGGGITSESTAAAEWEETQNKAGTMKAVLDMLDRKVG